MPAGARSPAGGDAVLCQQLLDLGLLGRGIGVRGQDSVDVADVLLLGDLRGVDAELAQLLRRAVVQLDLGEGMQAGAEGDGNGDESARQGSSRSMISVEANLLAGARVPRDGDAAVNGCCGVHRGPRWKAVLASRQRLRAAACRKPPISASARRSACGSRRLRPLGGVRRAPRTGRGSAAPGRTPRRCSRNWRIAQHEAGARSRSASGKRATAPASPAFAMSISGIVPPFGKDASDAARRSRSCEVRYCKRQVALPPYSLRKSEIAPTLTMSTKKAETSGRITNAVGAGP